MAKLLLGYPAERLMKNLSSQDFNSNAVQSAVKWYDKENQIVEGFYIDNISTGETFCVFACYANNGDCFCENFNDCKDALKWLVED